MFKRSFHFIRRFYSIDSVESRTKRPNRHSHRAKMSRGRSYNKSQAQSGKIKIRGMTYGHIPISSTKRPRSWPNWLISSHALRTVIHPRAWWTAWPGPSQNGSFANVAEQLVAVSVTKWVKTQLFCYCFHCIRNYSSLTSGRHKEPWHRTVILHYSPTWSVKSARLSSATMCTGAIWTTSLTRTT